MASAESSITVDPELFEDRDDSMSVFVETDEIETAVQVLDAATPRLHLVTFDGHEYESDDAWRAADMATGGGFETTNANFVHDVERRPNGAYLMLDTKGAATSAMGRTVVRIVTEGLRQRRIARAHLRPVRRSDWNG